MTSPALATIPVYASWALLAMSSGCFDPQYNNPTCGPGGACPDGFGCVDGVCWIGGVVIDAAVIDGLLVVDAPPQPFDGPPQPVDAPLPDAAPAPACPGSYVMVAGLPHKYRTVSGVFTYSAANNNCISDLPGYTYLVVPEDSSENTAMDYSGSKWIGINDMANEGQWRTSQGNLVSFFNWSTGEPSGGGQEDCVWGDGNDQWRDDDCNSGHGYVCECDGL